MEREETDTVGCIEQKGRVKIERNEFILQSYKKYKLER